MTFYFLNKRRIHFSQITIDIVQWSEILIFVTFPVMTQVSYDEIGMFLSVFFVFTQQSASKAATCYMAAALSRGNASKMTVSSSYAELYQIFTSFHALFLIRHGCIP